jgi:hypothetical protein
MKRGGGWVGSRGPSERSARRGGLLVDVPLVPGLGEEALPGALQALLVDARGRLRGRRRLRARLRESLGRQEVYVSGLPGISGIRETTSGNIV